MGGRKQPDFETFEGNFQIQQVRKDFIGRAEPKLREDSPIINTVNKDRISAAVFFFCFRLQYGRLSIDLLLILSLFTMLIICSWINFDFPNGVRSWDDQVTFKLSLVGKIGNIFWQEKKKHTKHCVKILFTFF